MAALLLDYQDYALAPALVIDMAPCYGKQQPDVLHVLSLKLQVAYILAGRVFGFIKITDSHHESVKNVLKWILGNV